MATPIRRTKLVCTIGPATADRIGELVDAGMDVARLNFSHGTDADHVAQAADVRARSADAGRAVAVVADLPGPKVRLGDLAGGELELQGGQEVRLGAGRRAPEASASILPVTYPGLADDVAAGDRLMLSDGAVELRVIEATGGMVRAEVIRGGLVRSGAGLNAPSERLGLPAVTSRDREALAAIGRMRPDYVAQSFVRRADDIRQLRGLLADAPIPIMAKIETRAAIEHLDEILAEADAVMLARGDLGVEISFAEVPLVQKRVIRACVEAGLPVVVATQMLESMVSAPRPTRAEASDVANAVLDGADAVMLSAETAIGAYPVLAARAAVGICAAAEGGIGTDRLGMDHASSHDPMGEAGAIAAAAVELARNARDLPVVGIGCFTRSGQTARLLSRLRPGCRITALSPDAAVVRRMALWRAVVPRVAEAPADTDAMIGLLDRALRESGLEAGHHVVLVASIPFGASTTNFLKLHRLGTSG